VYIPSAFSPNGDGINDLFRVFPGAGVGRVVSVEIYDRWGGIMFRGVGDQASWDGRHQDGKLAVGTFIYVVRTAYLDGEQKTFSGAVTLLR
ncbi:MAG: gliding motility-associated C-terminal domain-containing protein, partial [Bacteroidota bacterium]